MRLVLQRQMNETPIEICVSEHIGSIYCNVELPILENTWFQSAIGIIPTCQTSKDSHVCEEVRSHAESDYKELGVTDKADSNLVL